MQNHDEPGEKKLSQTQIESLESVRIPRAHVGEQIIEELHNRGILRRSVNSNLARRRPLGAKPWLFGAAALAATITFFVGVRVGEMRSEARSARMMNQGNEAGVATGDVSQPRLIWY